MAEYKQSIFKQANIMNDLFYSSLVVLGTRSAARPAGCWYLEAFVGGKFI